MSLKPWGAEIWEQKNRHHGDVGVIMGTGFGRRQLDRNTTRTLAVIDEMLGNLPTGAAVLDAGIGPSARFTIALSERGWQMTGLDVSPESLRRAGEQLRQAGHTADLIEGDLTDFTLAEPMDAIICVETFFHIPAHLALAAFGAFNRNLKPGGSALVQFSVQNQLSPGFLLKTLLYMSAYSVLRKPLNALGRNSFYVTVARYSEAEIHDIASRAGFRVAGRNGGYFLFEKASGVENS